MQKKFDFLLNEKDQENAKIKFEKAEEIDKLKAEKV